MKKILLSLAAFAVVLATSAQSIIPNGWYASFEPVSESAELKGVHTATAADGSVTFPEPITRPSLLQAQKLPTPKD